MMKKFLIAVLAVAGFAAAYAGIQYVGAAASSEQAEVTGVAMAPQNPNEWDLVKAVDYSAAGATIPGGGNFQEATATIEGGALKVVNPTATSNNWDLQYPIIDGLSLEGGVDYRVVVTMSADKDGNMSTWLGNWDGNDPKYGVGFSAAKKEIVLDHTAKNTITDGIYIMQTGSFVGTTNIYKVEVYKPHVNEDAVYDWVEVTADEHVVKLYKDQFSNQSGAITVVSQAQKEQAWDTQIWFVMDKALDAKTKVKLTFDAKASSAQNLGFGAHGAPDGNNWKAGNICNAIDVTTDWQTFEREFTAQAGWQSFALDLTKAAEVTYDFKNIKIEAWQEIELVTEVEPALVCGEEEYGLNTHSIVTVESASAITANILNCPQAIGASYNINVMNMGQDDEGIFWSVGQEIAAGEMSLSGVAYAELEKPINFEAGKKYQLAITVYGQPASDPVEVGTYYFEFAGSYIAPEYVEETSDMTKEMFCQWDGFGAVANVVRTSAGACDLGISTGLPYGDGNVAGSYYANLSEYTTLALTVTEGTPRLLLNRQGMDNSGNYIEINNANSPYVLSTEGGVWVIDLAKIVEEAGYAHLNCIKGANWANTTITAMKLTKLVEAEPVEPAVLPSLIAGEEEIALNSHSEATVESAEAVAVAFEGFVPFGASYSLATLKQVATAEGTEWVADKKIAEGMMSLSGKAYAEFGKTVVFEQGTKYQLEVVWRDVEGIINGTAQFIINGATAKGIATDDYVIKNVATGAYLNGANDWGTRASVTKHGQFFTVTEVGDNLYTLDSHISNGGASQFLGTNCFVDGGATNFVIEAVGNGTFAIKNGNAYLATNANDNKVNFDATEATAAAQWVFTSKADLIAEMASATAEAPVDVTPLIADANFGRNNLGWNSWAWQFTTGGTNHAKGGANENMCAESFHQGFVVSQTIENVPDGVYAMCAQGFYRQDGADNDNLPYFFINDDKINLKNVVEEGATTQGGGYSVERDGVFIPNSMNEASQIFTNGGYTTGPVQVVVTDGKITLGVSNEVNTNLWVIFDNIELYYLGEVPAEMTVTPSLFAGFEDLEAAYAGELGTEYTLNAHSLVSVDVAEGLHVEVANCPEAIGITFMLNEMVQGQDEDVTFWHVGKELAVGEINMKLDSYAAFEAPITFYAGTKYQLTVTVFAEVNGEPAEISTTTYQFNGASAPVNGSVADGINSIELNSVNGKFIKNGKVVIVKNGKTYNVNGVQVK